MQHSQTQASVELEDVLSPLLIDSFNVPKPRLCPGLEGRAEDFKKTKIAQAYWQGGSFSVTVSFCCAFALCRHRKPPLQHLSRVLKAIRMLCGKKSHFQIISSHSIRLPFPLLCFSPSYLNLSLLLTLYWPAGNMYSQGNSHHQHKKVN